MRKQSLICDNCGTELVEDTQYPAKFSLELTAINTGYNTSDITYAVIVKPPFREAKHFCNIQCITEWLKR